MFKNNKIILIIPIVAILIGIAIFLYKKTSLPLPKKVQTIAQVRNTPPLSKEAKKAKDQAISNVIKDNNGDKLLSENENYKIEYAPAPDAFFVNIVSNDIEKYDEFNTEIENWFLEKGFPKADLCNITIIYVTDPNLRLINFTKKLPSCQ